MSSKQRIGLAVIVATALWAIAGGVAARGQAAAPAKVRAVGTIKSISENAITLTTDSGAEMTVVL